jgi:1-acyl-sn-glycerol-3-phosphate acyltransferase
MTNKYSVPSPRKIFVRRLIRIIGKLLLRIFARPIIINENNIQICGPVILAGNHVAVLEIVMMAVYTPAIVEFLGTGDIPLDPKFSWLANLYGFIPIQRGSVDRAGINNALSVLAQGGVLGVFPQGGIWDTTVSQTRIGTALLSQKSGAPVIPIGFGGMNGALRRILRFERPRLVMNIGSPIYFPEQANKDISNRDLLEMQANLIINSIVFLLPENDRVESNPNRKESFDLELHFIDKNGATLTASESEVSQIDREALGRLFHYPILLDALYRNLKLPVQSMTNLEKVIDPTELVEASLSILEYLKNNPGFFTYRFGVEKGIAIASALSHINTVVMSRAGNLKGVKIVPIYRYEDPENGQKIEERGTRKLHSM